MNSEIDRRHPNRRQFEDRRKAAAPRAPLEDFIDRRRAERREERERRRERAAETHSFRGA